MKNMMKHFNATSKQRTSNLYPEILVPKDGNEADDHHWPPHPVHIALGWVVRQKRFQYLGLVRSKYKRRGHGMIQCVSEKGNFDTRLKNKTRNGGYKRVCDH